MHPNHSVHLSVWWNAASEQEYPASGFSSSLTDSSQADMQSIFDLRRLWSASAEFPEELLEHTSAVVFPSCQSPDFCEWLGRLQNEALSSWSWEPPWSHRCTPSHSYKVFHSPLSVEMGPFIGKGTAVRVFSREGCYDVVLHTHSPLTVGHLTLGTCLYFWSWVCPQGYCNPAVDYW